MKSRALWKPAVPIARGLVAITATLFSLGLAEVALHLFVEPTPLPQEFQESVQHQGDNPSDRAVAKGVVHPFVGWSGRPVHSWDPNATFPQRNQFGLPSWIEDYRTLQRQDFLIGVFGGSVALNLTMLNDAWMTQRIEEEFPELAGTVRIVNAADGGYKQPQQLMMLSEMLVLGVPFDVVVNLDGFNEAALGLGNVYAQTHPIFPHYQHMRGLLALGNETITEGDLLLSARIVTLRRKAAKRQQQLEENPLARLHLVREWLVRSANRHLNQAVEAELSIDSEGLSSRLTTELAEPCLEKPRSCERLVTQIWSRSSRAMQALTRASGARYIHFLQPNQHIANSKLLSEQEIARFYAPDHPWSQAYVAIRPRLKRHAQWMIEDGIVFVDLTHIFSDHPETLYEDSCCHLNARGSRLLAGSIVGHLVPLIDEIQQSRSEESIEGEPTNPTK